GRRLTSKQGQVFRETGHRQGEPTTDRKRFQANRTTEILSLGRLSACTTIAEILYLLVIMSKEVTDFNARAPRRAIISPRHASMSRISAPGSSCDEMNQTCEWLT